MDARTQSALLAAVVCLALALAMLLRKGRTRLWTAFALLNVSLLAYQLGDFVTGVFGSQPWPLRLTLAAAGFIPSAVLGFIGYESRRTSRRATDPLSPSRLAEASMCDSRGFGGQRWTCKAMSWPLALSS